MSFLNKFEAGLVSFLVVIALFYAGGAPIAYAESNDFDLDWDSYSSYTPDSYSSYTPDSYSSYWDDSYSSYWDDSYSSYYPDSYSSYWDDSYSSYWDDSYSSYYDDSYSSYYPDSYSSYFDDSYSSYYPDSYSSYWDDSYSSYSADYDAYDVYDEYDVYTYEDGIAYSYMDYSSPDCGGGCYSALRGCTTCSTPRVSTPPIQITAPRYSTSYPPVSYPPQRPQPPIVTQPSSTNVVTNNTCTGGSCNTSVNNIDNSVNGSFNTSPAVAPVIPVYQTPPQYLVQYTYPQTVYPAPNPILPNLYCNITASPGNVQNGQPAFLSWTSSPGVTSAFLSDGLGLVAPNGSLAVRPNVSTNYVLTVNGVGGSRTCSTFVHVSGTYVSLTQIPYTGFDFGTLGNAIYWAGMLLFALALAYLALYYKGGASVFMTPVVSGIKTKSSTRENTIGTPAIFKDQVSGVSYQMSAAQMRDTRVTREVEDLPTKRSVEAPKDAMTFAASTKEGERPRIVVNRS